MYLFDLGSCVLINILNILLYILGILLYIIPTIAIESKGTYLQNLFATLQGPDLQMLLCNG